ncbi:MAG: hypothetical protein JW861_01810 [Bacteroidales bacterium]|nr:hypothetical protein [Bacteroidales bacterium]
MKEEKINEKGLSLIYKHKGKRITYESYLKRAPEMARKYCEFVARNAGATYIRWDSKKNKFVA